MPLSKSLFIATILVLCLSFCNQKTEPSYKDIAGMPDGLDQAIPVNIEKELILDTEPDIIGSIRVFRKVDDKFLVIDAYHSRQCYLFDGNGKLLKKIGSYGEGPGQYLIVLAACCSGDRIFLFSGPTIHIYDKNGEFIKRTMLPFFGICTDAYPAFNGSVYALSYGSFNTCKDTIYQLNQDGELLKSFSPAPSGIPDVFETYLPLTGLCLEETTFSQYFNFRYQFTQFDYDGNKLKEIKLSSSLYTSPVFRNISGEGHKAEKDYRTTFTQVNGLFPFSKGYVAILTNWKNVKESQRIFEFWSKDFSRRLGFVEISGEEIPLGVYEDRIITADFENETKLIFRKINENWGKLGAVRANVQNQGRCFSI